MAGDSSLEQYDISFSKKLGDGTGGEVFSGKHRPSGRAVAIKVVTFNELLKSKSKMVFYNETKINELLRQMNTCKYITVALDSIDLGEKGYLIMDKFDRDLFDVIQASGKLRESEFRPIFRNLCKAVASLHEMKVAHLDLKPENVLMKHTKPYLADFGTAVILSKQTGLPKGLRGTKKYSAPEMENSHQGYNPFAADIFSLGILAHVAVTGYFPYSPDSKELVCDLRYLQSVVSSDCYVMISAMLNSVPALRPDIFQILNSDWLIPPRKYLPKKLRRSLEALMDKVFYHD